MSKLQPTIVTEVTMGDVAFDNLRVRPIVAKNASGKLVVCCRRTAKKHGWAVEGSLHTRTTRTARKSVSELLA